MKEAFVDLLMRMRRLPNHISPSPYDTAWVAWLYPEAREWIIDTQRPDGSWGAELEYYHDRVVATLAAINAIAATSTNRHDLKRIEGGISYLERAIPHLTEDVFETVSFELLVPSLVHMGQKLGLHLDRVEELIRPIKPFYDQKLALIPKTMIYSPDIALAHSLEFIGFEKLDHAATEQLRAINSSIHNSPSATAFVEVATNGSNGFNSSNGSNGSNEGRMYLDVLIARYSGVAPALAPFELFEMIWALHHLSLNVELESLRPTIDPFLELLGNVWTPKGVGFSATFIPDSDDTSLGLRLLHKIGIYADPLVLEAYEVDDHFQCLPFERNISLDIHIHIVHALKESKDFSRRDDMLLKALNILARHLTTEYIVDKWHVPPYYSTSHAVMWLAGLSDNIITKQINWLLKTQRNDGAWTFYPHHPKAAIEETAYVLMALMTVYEKGGDIPFSIIDKGFRYLASHYTAVEELPSLWIHKVLYNPYHIVEAIILSALAKYEDLKRKVAWVVV